MSDITEPNDDPVAAPPVEEFQLTWTQGLFRFLWSAPLLTMILVVLICGGFALFVVCLVISRGVPANGLDVEKIARFATVAVSFCAIIVFPMTLATCLTGRGRKYWVESDQLCAQLGGKSLRLDLQACTYTHQGKLGCDKQGYYSGKVRPRITVSDGEQVIALAFSEELAGAWSDYFDAVGVRHRTPFPWLTLLFAGISAIVVGALTGFLIESMLALFGGPVRIPLGSLPFVGAIDGGVLAMFAVGSRHGKTRIADKYPWLVVMMVGSALSGIAMQWSGVWEFAVINGVFGAACTWLILPNRSELLEPAE